MGRKSLLKYNFLREYDSCNNPEKDKIVELALIQLKALPKV
jgi:hypothetical protein